MLRELIDEQGFALTHPLLSASRCDGLLAVLERLVPETGADPAGIRNILRRCPEVRALVRSRPVHGLVASVLSADAFAVRAIYFRKMPESNWSIRWHQDRSIPLHADTTPDAVTAAGMTGWSIKEGVPHAKAPDSVLAGMLTVRIHLDAADAANGALQVLPGSHLLSSVERPEIPPYLCECPRGVALLMRPLLWHASSRVEEAAPRRVLHIEFAEADLPGGLDWQDRW